MTRFLGVYRRGTDVRIEVLGRRFSRLLRGMLQIHYLQGVPFELEMVLLCSM